ncbi:hypothetical protein WX45_03826 [Clostridium ljungdahlii DSM 13528]|uniref:DUF192 domain-containing protein n=1 Tax=Clostridium ljungdahlii (strain ATCC 55383 / DSM 13528 / PETC) TaxID=748727 RepID=D8GP48_CLOLD|nr:conserved hypothetical protein [Clostridium ljungdahlii DSM 13528]ALU35272.1 hypothetical protein CLAU_0843 [Clostridium autoethanogenum DSM 10061]OAA87196.1 hypothetical protein WX45_03826 [Clostridium ljungdahlii DSM 13528]OVY49649.1 hypothetical protein WX72_03574 [Clostridium autoethanogenum]
MLRGDNVVKILVYESKVIAEIFIADSFVKRFLGFMFRKKPHHEGILIKPCNSIHTFFMKFSIDVLFVSEDMKVIKKVEDLKPGKIIMPQGKAKMVIEGSTGTFKNVEEGKLIEIRKKIYIK